ncbi:MAG: hypothetical protein CMM02_00630 [Rhodopirellula sp.]|nr:hypothetical protein [Rhodopirellula sp.]
MCGEERDCGGWKNKKKRRGERRIKMAPVVPLTSDRDDVVASAPSESIADDDEDARFAGELLLAGAAACFALIPHVFGAIVAINGMICHITAAHRSACAFPAACWDSACTVLVVGYVVWQPCSHPVTPAGAIIALLGMLVVLFSPGPRSRAAAHFGLVQAPGFAGLLFFALMC